VTPLVVGVVVAAALLVARLPWGTGGRAVPRARVRSPSGPRPLAGGSQAAASRRRVRPRRAPDVLDPAFVLDLCAAAIRGGAAVPAALAITGRHLGGTEGDALLQVGTALSLGATWDSAWAGAPVSVAALGRVLGVGREAGASPGPQLRAAAARLRRERRAHVRAAAGALGVRLTLPLGLCFLPAFVLLGLVPVVLGLAGDLLGGSG